MKNNRNYRLSNYKSKTFLQLQILPILFRN